MIDFEKNANIKVAEPYFSDKDATFGVVLFIILQMAIIYVAKLIIQSGVSYSTVFSEILSVLIEASFVLSVFIISKYGKKNFIKATGIDKKINWRMVLICFVICLICLLGLSRISSAFMAVLEAIGYHSSASSVEVKTIWDLLIYTVLVALIPAVCEEIMFRGLVLNGLARHGKHFAVIISALLFTLMHGSPDQTVHQFILGIVFGYIVYFTGNVLLTIIIHFFNNFIVLVVSFIYNMASNGVAEETIGSAYGSIIAIVVSTIISIAIIVLAIYLIISEIKRLSQISNRINSTPEYLSEKDCLTMQNGEQNNFNDVNLSNVDENLISESGQAILVSEPKEDKKLSKRALIYLIISVCYLGIDWITALINGFVR